MVSQCALNIAPKVLVSSNARCILFHLQRERLLANFKWKICVSVKIIVPCAILFNKAQRTACSAHSKTICSPAAADET